MTFALDVCGDVVIVSGSLDIATAPALREALLTLVADRDASVVVDLDGVDFIDSTGLGVPRAQRASSPPGWRSVIICSPADPLSVPDDRVAVGLQVQARWMAIGTTRRLSSHDQPRSQLSSERGL